MDERVICLQGGGTTSIGQQGGDGYTNTGICYTLTTLDIHGVCYASKRYAEYVEDIPMIRASGGDIGGGSEALILYPSRTGALCANSHPGSYTGQDAFNDMFPVIKEKGHLVARRLTPVECARLQGFPDWWTDGVEGSDSNKYKMWGNGIALPCAADVIGRLAKELDKRI